MADQQQQRRSQSRLYITALLTAAAAEQARRTRFSLAVEHGCATSLPLTRISGPKRGRPDDDDAYDPYERTTRIARIKNRTGIEFAVLRTSDARFVLISTYFLQLGTHSAGGVEIETWPDMDGIDLSYVYIEPTVMSTSVRGTGLCVPLVAACLRDVLARVDKVPSIGTVTVKSDAPRQAAQCYVAAFRDVGYTLDENSRSRYERALTSDDKTQFTLSFISTSTPSDGTTR
jgi:hypothetical protein